MCNMAPCVCVDSDRVCFCSRGWGNSASCCSGSQLSRQMLQMRRLWTSSLARRRGPRMLSTRWPCPLQRLQHQENSAADTKDLRCFEKIWAVIEEILKIFKLPFKILKLLWKDLSCLRRHRRLCLSNKLCKGLYVTERSGWGKLGSLLFSWMEQDH